LVREAMDRSIRPTAGRRHLAAILAAPSRAKALGQISVPLLVIHGEADPLIPFQNAVRVAAAVPGSRLVSLPDIGHELPPEIWPTLVEAIVEHAHAARRRQQSG
jgi:pimeloyl-ACP methyl ester carboxylesterase